MYKLYPDLKVLLTIIAEGSFVGEVEVSLILF